MAATKTNGQTAVIAVYPDQRAAEDAVRRLQVESIPVQTVSIVANDFLTALRSFGFVTAGGIAQEWANDCHAPAGLWDV